MAKKKLITTLITTCMIVASLSGCGGRMYEDTSSSYTNIDAVPGVTFDIPTSILETATAVTSLEGDGNYSGNTFLYKDGQSQYVLFNMGSFVVAADNRTRYAFKEHGKDALGSGDLNGIWFSPSSKGIKFNEADVEGIYKAIMNVQADVSITPELYGTFTGQLATVESNGYECSLFIGVDGDGTGVKTLNSSQQSTIAHVVRSLKYNAGTAQLTAMADEEEPEDEVTPGISEKEEEEDTKESGRGLIKKIDDYEDEDEEEESSDQSDKKWEIQDVGEDDGSEKESRIKKTGDVESEEPEEPEESEEPEEDEVVVEKGEEKEEKEEKPKKKKEAVKQVASGQNNQKGNKGDGSSDIYHMLSIGQTGSYETIDQEGGLISCSVNIEKLQTGDKAKHTIETLCFEEEKDYEEAPPGTSWHVIKYSVSDSQDDVYTNICLRGLDGNDLVYRGVVYSKRTRDLLGRMKTAGEGYGNIYCYYAIPNGCTEYMLEVGEREDGTGATTACYYVDGFREVPKRTLQNPETEEKTEIVAPSEPASEPKNVTPEPAEEPKYQ